MTPPTRPSARQEALASRLFLALAPRFPRVPPATPPAAMAPYELLELPRSLGRGRLAATWFPADRHSRGAVLLLPPWSAKGRAYLHRHGRIAALKDAGYDVMTVDLPGFGASGPPAGFFDRDVEDALGFLAGKRSGPLHVWGISSGGYWAHPAIPRFDRVRGVLFEDVSPHLLEWSWRIAPLGRPFYVFFRRVLGTAYRYLDMREHASAFEDLTVTYISGASDKGVRPEDTRELAERAGATYHVVPGADHLAAIKVASSKVLSLALETFERAVDSRDRDVRRDPSPRRHLAARAASPLQSPVT